MAWSEMAKRYCGVVVHLSDVKVPNESVYEWTSILETERLIEVA